MDLKPELKNFLTKVINVVTIFTVIYAVVSYIYVTISTLNYIYWFQTGYFTLSVILLVFLSIANKIITTGKFPQPRQPEKQVKFNIPDYYGVKGDSINLLSRKWTCPKCGLVNVNTNRCRRCGYERKI